MVRTILVSLPFADVRRPSIGLGLLSAALQRDGLSCEVRYLNLDFAEFIGVNDYLNLDNFVVETLLGEWIFSKALWGKEISEAVYFYLDVLKPVMDQAMSATERSLDSLLDQAHFVAGLAKLQDQAVAFIDHCVADLEWAGADIVGFTTTFQQNVASLALAKRLKRAYPDICIAFGGANCEGEMGLALHRLFPFIDVVCSGEGDLAFPAFAREYLRGDPCTPIDGIIRRIRGRTLAPPAMNNLVENMDALPLPDYEEYFRAFARLQNSQDIRETLLWDQPTTLLIESSRGCWWGEKHHCTFCGLNGGGMRHRSKSPARFVEEVDCLSSTYKVFEFAAVDNIIDMKYFDTVLPQLAQRDVGVQLFYETKANLKEQQVRALRDAGVTKIQPGIESLSSNLLHHMRKGVKAYQNVRLLRYCAEYLVEPHWNILSGFPRESPADFVSQTKIVPSLTHLPPPMHVTRVRLDRFSPLFDNARELGAVNVRAAASYAHVYPFEPKDLYDLAYYFDFDYDDGRDPETYIGPLRAAVADWKSGRDHGMLLSLDDGAQLVIADARGGRVPHQVHLTGWQREIYVACTDGASLSELDGLAIRASSDQVRLRCFIDEMVAARLILMIDERFLALAVRGDFHLEAWAKHIAKHGDAPPDRHLCRAVQWLFALHSDDFARHLTHHIAANDLVSARSTMAKAMPT
jgi:ribosomal peptide maturation radical SAM protein 1